MQFPTSVEGGIYKYVSKYATYINYFKNVQLKL